MVVPGLRSFHFMECHSHASSVTRSSPSSHHIWFDLVAAGEGQPDALARRRAGCCVSTPLTYGCEMMPHSAQRQPQVVDLLAEAAG